MSALMGPILAQIRALDPTTLKEATSARPALPVNVIYDVVITEPARYDEVFPFRIVIETPYWRAFISAAEARRRFLPAPVLTLSELNAEGVRIVVEPREFERDELIEDLVLKRGESVERPNRSQITPYTMQNRLGMTKKTARGAFYFPLTSLSPDKGPLTIICIAADKNYEWDLGPAELQRMR